MCKEELKSLIRLNYSAWENYLGHRYWDDNCHRKYEIVIQTTKYGVSKVTQINAVKIQCTIKEVQLSKKISLHSVN